MALSRTAPVPARGRRPDQRRGSGAPRAGAGEPGPSRPVGDHPEPLRRPATDPAGRDRSQPPAHPVGPALRRRGLRRLHLGGRRTHPHGAGRLHHHSVLDLARPRQPPRRGRRRAGGLAGRPGHPDAAFLRRHLRRELRRTGAAVATWRRRQPRPLRQQHAAAAPPADDADLAAVQLPLRAQPRSPRAPGAPRTARSLGRPQAALRQPGHRRLGHADHRHLPATAAGRLPRAARAQHRRQRLFGGGRQRRGADRRPALRLRGQGSVRRALLGRAAPGSRRHRLRAVQFLRPPCAAGARHPPRIPRNPSPTEGPVP